MHEQTKPAKSMPYLGRGVRDRGRPQQLPLVVRQDGEHHEVFLALEGALITLQADQLVLPKNAVHLLLAAYCSCVQSAVLGGVGGELQLG